jgi:hypothetical protein
MHKSATKCNETLGKWCKNKHGASKIMDMFETYHVASPWPSSVSALDFVFMSGKIGSLAFVSSNSENIYCVNFLKYKNNRKQELALWYLVNRLVPENA